MNKDFEEVDSDMDNDSKNKKGFVGMSCSETELLVDDYIDAELSELDALRFERHVANCSSCREILRDTQRVVRTARLLSERPVSPAVSSRLRERLQQELGISLNQERKPHLSLVD